MFLSNHFFPSKRSAIVAASWSLVGLLTACGGGGGGGGGGGSSGSSLSTTPVALTSSNYQAAASETVSSANFITDSASLASGVEATTADTGKLLNFAKSQLKSVDLGSLGKLPTGTTSSTTIYCTSGSMSVVVNFAGSTLAAGDSATFTMNNCYDSATNSTYNGAFSIAITSLTGDFLNTYVYNIGMNLTFNNFVGVTGTTSVTGNGTVGVTETSTAIYSADTTLSASSMTASAIYGGTTYNRQLTDFLITQSQRPNSPTSTYKLTTSMSGTVSSTALGGNAVTVSTVTPFVQLSTALYPYIGQAIATGSGSSKVRLTAQSSTDVLIELDANGDGTYETSTVKTWASL